MLAWYLGKRLMYPLTCVGSRSLIRDGISAMVGPRMCVAFTGTSGDVADRSKQVSSVLERSGHLSI